MLKCLKKVEILIKLELVEINAIILCLSPDKRTYILTIRRWMLKNICKFWNFRFLTWWDHCFWRFQRWKRISMYFNVFQRFSKNIDTRFRKTGVTGPDVEINAEINVEIMLKLFIYVKRKNQFSKIFQMMPQRLSLD